MFKLSRSSTLFFTSAEPVESDEDDRRNNPGSVYSCALEEYGNKCVDSIRHAVGLNTTIPSKDSGWFSLMNLQLSKKEWNYTNPKVTMTGTSSDPLPTKDGDDGSDGNNDILNHYSLYASTLKESTAYKSYFSWKIFKADILLPLDRNLRRYDDVNFKPYFRTIAEFDWNNCDFQCCGFGDSVRDSNGLSFKRTQDDLRFQHAYIRTKVRTYAVDHQTGDIFIAWEGFYMNCIAPISKYLDWTIGVSRLRTEDPTCVSMTEDLGELGNNFVACTEPVAIVDVDTRNLLGRPTGLAFGGLAVVPAAKEPPSPGVQPRRSFLLSAFRKDGLVFSHLWAVPEGVDASQYPEKRQTLASTQMKKKNEFGSSLKGAGVWNGGNIKVHYNQKTGLPDFLCRTVYTEGIVCMPIEMTESGDSVRQISGEKEIQLLDRFQVASFCDTGQIFSPLSNSTEWTKRKSNYVSGLDILWNEEDGTPFKGFFGCVGIEGNGRLGSIDWYGGQLVEVLPDAFSGDVLLLPGNQISLGTMPSPPSGGSMWDTDTDTNTIIAPRNDNEKRSSLRIIVPIVIGVVIACVCLAFYGFYKKRFSSKRSPKKPQEKLTSGYEINEKHQSRASNSSGNADDQNRRSETIISRSNDSDEESMIEITGSV